MSLYEVMIGLHGYSDAHNKGGPDDNSPPLSADDLERRKAKIRAMNIKGLNI